LTEIQAITSATRAAAVVFGVHLFRPGNLPDEQEIAGNPVSVERFQRCVQYQKDYLK